MPTLSPIPRPLRFLRWTARIWSLVIIVFWLLIFVPDAVSQPIASEDWFLLSFIGLALLGLLIGLHWEAAGGILTIAALLLHQILFLLIKGIWQWGFLFLWFLIATPALLYLLAWRMEKSISAANPSGSITEKG